MWEAHPEWEGDGGAASTEAQGPQGAAASTEGGALAPALTYKACSFFQCLLSGIEAQGAPVLTPPVGNVTHWGVFGGTDEVGGSLRV